MAAMEGSSHTAPTNTTFADLFLAVPRLASRAGSFALFNMPDAMDNLAGKLFGAGSMIADATARHTANKTITNTSAAAGFVQSTAAAGTEVLDAVLMEGLGDATEDVAAGATGSGSVFGLMIQGLGRVKNFGGIFSYLTSRWALATFVAALVLNRTQFYASSRQHLRLKWYTRLLLYVIPIVGFLVQLLHILQALRCQTSPDFPDIRYGDPLKYLAIDFGGEGGFLYSLASTLLWWQDDAASCAARDMSLLSVDNDRTKLRGSMSLLFRFFLTLCASQYFETLSSALQGKQPMPEIGMTLFEHSLAFAESEAMISSSLGFGFFGLSKMTLSSPSGGAKDAGSGPLITRAQILQRLNVPPEVLLVCLISCFSHLSSAVLAVTGLRHKVRLVNTGIWACCYMSAFIWSFSKVFFGPVERISDLGVLRFPTVCIVGFIPHLLVLVGIIICAAIYSLALFATALSVPSDVAQGLSMRDRLSWAYGNLQANFQFSSASALRIKMSEDFYTTLLKIGFSVLTAASEAVYLNEGSNISVASMTWLEQKRIDDLATGIDVRRKTAVPAELLGGGIARGVDYTDYHNLSISSSPYAIERRSKPKKNDPERPNELDSGLGISQRRNRMQLTTDFFTGMAWLIASIYARLALKGLRRVGIEQRPAWLLRAAGVVKKEENTSNAMERSGRREELFFWTKAPGGGRTRVPEDGDVDVELELRKSAQLSGARDNDEERLSDRLYEWWCRGGWFGEPDASGDFILPNVEQDDDTTSMISLSTNDDDAGGWSDTEDESGRRTPTQDDPWFDRRSRESTPRDTGLDVSLLSRLLNPQTSSDKDEARLLSYSLQSNRPMTRSQYRKDTDRSRAQLLVGLRRSDTHGASSSFEAGEEQDLEQFILRQRSKARQRPAAQASTWESGAEGMGAGGPLCVVCQSSPRTVLVWPCGCLSACDDCRIGLATRNYTKCICCRTDVAAYSRLYVP